jgi:outer membrane biosynthesis protein TonB
MKYIAPAALLLVALAVLEAQSLPQQTPHPVRSDLTKGVVVLATLSNPTFSPLARQANLEGEVIVDVTVREDGSTEATLVKGHPLLKQAALDSAMQSRFDCRTCSAPLS